MAEEAKPADKKGAPAPAPQKDLFVEIVSFLAVMMVIMSLLNGIVNTITSSGFYNRGFRAFTPVGIWENHTRPIASLFNPIDEKVVSMKDTSVYDSAGGKNIGSHKLGDKGKILQGYVLFNGDKYWYVDYDKGVDGWVKEDDIAYLESEPNLFERMILVIFSIASIMKFVSILLVIIFIIITVYLFKNLVRLRTEARLKLYPGAQNVEGEFVMTNPKWEKILNHIESTNENDWKLAIIEADIMLDNLLDKLNLPGDTIGDKLKSVEKSDFLTINNAWEAHKIRNQIAHEGSDFALNQREVKRVVDLYKSVFEEFQII